MLDVLNSNPIHTAHPDLTDWLNRIGILLGFLSFWFAAPELLGQERLKQLESRLVYLAKIVNGIVGLLFVISFVACVFTIVHHLTKNEASKSLTQDFFELIAEIVVIPLLFGAIFLTFGNCQRLVQLVIARLADNRRRRQNALVIGAILFTISTVLQLIATF